MLLLAALGTSAFRNAEARDLETNYLASVETATAHLIDAQRQSLSLSESMKTFSEGYSTASAVRSQVTLTDDAIRRAILADPSLDLKVKSKPLELLDRIEDLANQANPSPADMLRLRSELISAGRGWLAEYQTAAMAEIKELSANRATNERNQGALLIICLVISGGLLTWTGSSVASAYRRAQTLIAAEEAKVASSRAALDHASGQLAHQARHDALTGLPNRTTIREKLEQSLKDANGQTITVLFCDLDRFKFVNDSLGHAIGDQLLIEAAARIQRSVGEEGWVGRIGGDEFVIISDQLADEESTLRLAERIQNSFHRPFEAGGTSAIVGVSIGIARSTEESTANQLLRAADVAMYRAKGELTGDFSRLDSGDDPFRGRFDTEMALRKAVTEQQFVIHWQPIVNLKNSQVHTLEALIRWERPGSGLVSPKDFLDVAEDSGLIHEIGRWVIQNACAAGALTVDRAVSVNVTASQLRHANFVEELRSTLAQTQFPPERLVIEVTEGSVIDPDVVQPALARVKELGVKVALDDFGTGYSSLSLLHRLPVDIVKLDRSFVRDLAESQANQAVIKALVQTTSALNMQLIVEGVESDQQRRLLRSLGVQNGQGYWFGEPEPGRLLRSRA